jgi:hypothetical protein
MASEAAKVVELLAAAVVAVPEALELTAAA